MTDRRAAAAAVLRAHGLDATTFDSAALDPAVVEAGVRGPDGFAFAAAIAEFGDARAARVLAGLEGGTVPPPARKAIRRALHRLRERGIAVPAAGAPPPATAAPAAEPEREAWTSACDGAGTRLVWVAAARPSGVWLLVAAELNEPGGLTDLRVNEVPKKQLRAARRHLRERGIAMVGVPFAVADALLVEGQARRGSVDRALDYLRVRPRLTPHPPLPPAEPRSAQVSDPVGDDRDALVAGSPSLLAEPELALWWPRPDDAAPFVEEIAGLADSPIVLTAAQQEGRLEAVLARASAVLHPRPLAARRLRATAYVFAESGRPAAARTALAVAAALEADPQGARPVPLLTTLVHQGLGRLAAAQAAQQRETREASLVVTPGEALTPRTAGRPPRTRS